MYNVILTCDRLPQDIIDALDNEGVYYNGSGWLFRVESNEQMLKLSESIDSVIPRNIPWKLKKLN